MLGPPLQRNTQPTQDKVTMVFVYTSCLPLVELNTQMHPMVRHSTSCLMLIYKCIGINHFHVLMAAVYIANRSLCFYILPWVNIFYILARSYMLEQ